MRKRMAACIGLTIIILIGGFIYALNFGVGDDTELNKKESDVYQDRMMPDQEDISPPYQNSDGSTSGAARPSSGTEDIESNFD
ncbi:hypothetical protein MH117_18315 [Paenibacillus sp. ACRRX]|uniref:hypothetical protein n=1 Tax=Paenibacillus sp. ACRRX TaxID=2918206 RepID=UPI001EF44A29|nr:hypothetical protein [Paenibacillus sp. ACRRX]MCG7409376.1 hypothetical protein [Paenibacillus sp. ACRRX]